MTAQSLSQLISLFAAFGLGSVVTALVQAWLSRSQGRDTRRFDEKKAAYVGLLEAYHRAALEGTIEAGKNFAYWQMRCELVAPESVREAIREIVATNEDPMRRAIAHEFLKEEIRRDMGIVR